MLCHRETLLPPMGMDTVVTPPDFPVGDEKLQRAIDYLSYTWRLSEYKIPVPPEDIRQMLWCELIKEWPSHNPNKGALTTWAVMKGRRLLGHHLAKYKAKKRGGGLTRTRNTVLEARHIIDREPDMHREIRRKHEKLLTNMLLCIDPKLSRLLRTRLNGTSLEDVAKEYGVTRLEIRKKECRALRALEKAASRR